MPKRIDSQLQALYLKLSVDLASREAGARLPSFTEIRARYGCTRRVLELALGQLAADGIIKILPRRGVFINPRQDLSQCRVMIVHTDWPQEYQAVLDRRLEKAISALPNATFLRRLVPPMPTSEDFCRWLTRKNADIAILCCNFHKFSQHDAAKILACEIPLIFLENHLVCHAVNLIDSMPEYSGMLAADYLIRNGHRKIACVQTDLVDICLRRELDGFYRYLALHNIVPELIDCRHPPCESSYASAEEKSKCYLEKHGLNFTGAFVSSVFAAKGFYAALNSLGYSIPGDVSVIANSEVPSAAAFDPPLSTIARDFNGYVKTAVKMIQQIRCGEHPGIISVPSYLIDRQSMRNLNDGNFGFSHKV